MISYKQITRKHLEDFALQKKKKMNFFEELPCPCLIVFPFLIAIGQGQNITYYFKSNLLYKTVHNGTNIFVLFYTLSSCFILIKRHNLLLDLYLVHVLVVSIL